MWSYFSARFRLHTETVIRAHVLIDFAFATKESNLADVGGSHLAMARMDSEFRILWAKGITRLTGPMYCGSLKPGKIASGSLDKRPLKKKHGRWVFSCILLFLDDY